MNRYFVQSAFFALVLSFSVAPPSSAQTARKGEIEGVTPHETYLPSFKKDGSRGKIKNVILMIGDGMGLGAVNAGMYANGGSLTLTNLRTVGFVRTQSASDFTTDSAASGTAYATGVKTFNGAVGVAPDSTIVSNIVEMLSSKGYSTGILTTDFLDGATPSAFYAHQNARGASMEIWSDLPDSPLNFVSGGCRDAVEALPDQIKNRLYSNYEVVYGVDGKYSGNKLCYLPERGECDSVNNPERGDYLPATTDFAIQYLSSLSKKGFFLMVEGARIDKSAHSNDFPAVVREVLDFDKAVEAAIRFAEKDGHTLVIISADHETGALTIRKGDPSKGKVTGVFCSGGHSPMTVPLFAYGPCSDLFMGVQENSDVCNKIKTLLDK